MFFLISGLVVTSGLLREEAAAGWTPCASSPPARAGGAQIVPLCAALLSLSFIDPTDANSLDQTLRTVTNSPDLHHQPALPDQPAGCPG